MLAAFPVAHHRDLAAAGSICCTSMCWSLFVILAMLLPLRLSCPICDVLLLQAQAARGFQGWNSWVPRTRSCVAISRSGLPARYLVSGHYPAVDTQWAFP